MFKEGEANGYLAKNSIGSVYTADLWHGLLSYCTIVDFTNPKAVQWYKTKVKALLNEGVDVVKKEELFIRWSQFGLFSSHSRLHGTTTRQPWAYGDKACAILADFIRHRYKLMPYILKTAASCVKNGVPFIQPLVMENSDDPPVFGIWDEYYFGNDIIVAPVFGGDNVKRSIYLPCGEWQDFLTGEEFEGNNWYTITCPIEYMPILVKKDANISLNLQQT